MQKCRSLVIIIKVRPVPMQRLTKDQRRREIYFCIVLRQTKINGIGKWSGFFFNFSMKCIHLFLENSLLDFLTVFFMCYNVSIRMVSCSIWCSSGLKHDERYTNGKQMLIYWSTVRKKMISYTQSGNFIVYLESISIQQLLKSRWPFQMFTRTLIFK